MHDVLCVVACHVFTSVLMICSMMKQGFLFISKLTKHMQICKMPSILPVCNAHIDRNDLSSEVYMNLFLRS